MLHEILDDNFYFSKLYKKRKILLNKIEFYNIKGNPHITSDKILQNEELF